MRAVFSVLCAVSLAFAAPATAGELPRSTAKLTTKEASLAPRKQSSIAPLAYQLFCLQNPSQCQRGPIESVSLTPKLSQMLQTVNLRVNRTIRPSQDRGNRDVWQIGVTSGDCEDYVLEKRRQLIGAGVPSGALRIAVVRTQTGEGHAVLVVKSNKGDLVLDNLRSSIVERRFSRYHWIKIATANPDRWQRL